MTDHTPYLSFSRVNRYLTCPEQYRLYYVENLRPKIPSASLLFGQVLHQSLSLLFSKREDPVKLFQEKWRLLKDVKVDYSQKESWEKLARIGQLLLEDFLVKEFSKIKTAVASEKPFRLTITGFALPFVGVIDLIADMGDGKAVVDFKTSASSYQPWEVLLSDQLSAYQLAEPDAAKTALCVLVKTQTPKIEWHTSSRNSAELMEFLFKLERLAAEILSGHFYKRPGKWCAWCDYLPLCTRDTAKANQTLTSAASEEPSFT